MMIICWDTLTARLWEVLPAAFPTENKRPTNEEEDQQARDIVYNLTDEIMRAICKAS